MKRNTFSLIAITVAISFGVLQVVYTRLSRAQTLQSKEIRFPRTFGPNYHTPSSLSLPQNTQHNFTCEENKAAVIDSFGTPCVDFSSFLRTQMIYVHSSNNLSYVYCGIPKNGCTYHIAMMHRLMGYPYEGGGNVHSQNNKDRLRTAHENITPLLLSEDVPKYAVIRNPMHRLLSAYLNKVERYKDENEKTPESFHKWIYEDEGLKPGMDWKNRNPHWMAQVSFCGFKIRDLADYFHIFRVEEPVEYLEYMESFLPESTLKDGWDMPLNKSFRQHVLGPRSRTENTTARFFQYMGNLRTFDYLSEVYREDIDLLGYRNDVNELREKFIEYTQENR